MQCMQWFCILFQTSVDCKGEQAAKPLLAQFMTITCSKMTGKMQYMKTNWSLPLTALEEGQKRTKSANYCGFSTQCLPLFLVAVKKHKLLQTSSTIKTTVCFSKKSKQLATMQTNDNNDIWNGTAFIFASVNSKETLKELLCTQYLVTRNF